MRGFLRHHSGLFMYSEKNTGVDHCCQKTISTHSDKCTKTMEIDQAGQSMENQAFPFSSVIEYNRWVHTALHRH